ncbi:MAG: MBL fold metallo-hydrolase [Gammaproteobacteria bacterium]
MTAKSFASQNDLTDKTISFVELGAGAYAYTAEGDPNAGVVVGDDSVLVVDTLATPIMARDLIQRIRAVTDKPVQTIVLSHYHAVRVLGASAFQARHIIASRGTYELIQERGEADYQSEYERFPRLFRGADSIPGLTWPNIVFEHKLTLWLGRREVQILHLGSGHTRGDTVVWLPQDRILFSGDLVEYNAGVYMGDAHLREWPETLEKLRALEPEKLVPGRGEAMLNNARANAAIDYTQGFVRAVYQCAAEGVKTGKSLKDVYADTRRRLDPAYGQMFIYEHCIPFNVSRAYDEASGIIQPRIWTAARDQEMWRALEAS